MHPRHLLLPLALGLLAACARPEPVPAPATPAAPAKPAAVAGDTSQPRLQVTLLDGTPYDLAAKRGKWVVVNFWATWCGPCLKEMPELSALADKRDDVEVIGLAYEEIEKADMQAFLAKVKPTYPIAIVDTYEPPADFETPRGLPMTVLIAPDGRVAKKVVGPVTVADLEQAIAAGAPPA